MKRGKVPLQVPVTAMPGVMASVTVETLAVSPTLDLVGLPEDGAAAEAHEADTMTDVMTEVTTDVMTEATTGVTTEEEEVMIGATIGVMNTGGTNTKGLAMTTGVTKGLAMTTEVDIKGLYDTQTSPSCSFLCVFRETTAGRNQRAIPIWLPVYGPSSVTLDYPPTLSLVMLMSSCLCFVVDQGGSFHVWYKWDCVFSGLASQ